MDVTELQSSAFSNLHETETVACTELADAIYLLIFVHYFWLIGQFVFVFSRFTFLFVWEVTPGCVTVQSRWKEHLIFMLVFFYFFLLFLHRFNKILIVFKQLFVLILCCTLILYI